MQLRERSWSRRLVGFTVVAALVGAAAGWLASTVVVPGYDASAFLLITADDQSPVQGSEVQYTQAVSQIVTNPSVLASGGSSDDLPDPERVRADASPNAPMIELVVNAATPDTARRQAQAVTEAVAAYTQERVDVLGFRTVVLAPATDGEPAGLSLPAYLAAGAAMGAVLGAVAAMLRGERRTEVLDPWPRGDGTTAEVVEPTETSVGS